MLQLQTVTMYDP